MPVSCWSFVVWFPTQAKGGPLIIPLAKSHLDEVSFMRRGEAVQPNAVIDVLLIETLLKNSGPKNHSWNGTEQSRRRKYLEHKILS